LFFGHSGVRRETARRVPQFLRNLGSTKDIATR
jgi:hypothetical protein